VRYFIGVDVGGTTTTLAVGNKRREVLYVAEQFPTRSEQGPHAVVQLITEHVQAEVEKLGAAMSDIAAVGLATPGPATVDGLLLKTPNLNPELWDQFPIRAELEHSLKKCHPEIRVHYLGDGQAAALGEYAVRSGAMTWKAEVSDHTPDPAISSLFMVIVGTGLGGGAVSDARLVRGRKGRAGHVGHITLPPHAFRYEHDRKLQVGNAYCTAESAVSLTGLVHQLEYRLSLPAWKEHRLHGVPGTIRDKAKQLRVLAAEGDQLALELFEDQARALGITMLNANYLGDYDLLVIGGGVCDLAPQVREWYARIAAESYRQHALDGFRDFDGFEFSLCGDDAPVIGALAWVVANTA